MTINRIQRKRTKGYRLPEGAVYVGRPTIFGNPFPMKDASLSVKTYREWLDGTLIVMALVDKRREVMKELKALRGKDLCCWCSPSAPCHADVLIDFANRPELTTNG